MTAEAAPSAWGPNGRVEGEVPCVNCGYILHSLAMAGKCPECGTPITQSLHPDDLRFSNPQWVGTLKWGMALMLGAIPLLLICSYVQITPPAIGKAVEMIPQLVGLWSIWLLTKPEPRQSSLRREGGTREALRICAVGYCMFGLASLIPMAPYFEIHEAVKILLKIIFLPYLFLEFAYFRILALRIPNTKLARSCRVVMWGLVVGLALLYIDEMLEALGFTVLPSFVPATSSGVAANLTWLNYYGLVSVGLILICGVVFGMWTFLLNFRLYRAFAQAARSAAKNAQLAKEGLPPVFEEVVISPLLKDTVGAKAHLHSMNIDLAAATGDAWKM